MMLSGFCHHGRRGRGNDTLYGGTGNDELQGDGIASQVSGQFHGNDYLDGEDGDDQEGAHDGPAAAIVQENDGRVQDFQQDDRE